MNIHAEYTNGEAHLFTLKAEAPSEKTLLTALWETMMHGGTIVIHSNGAKPPHITAQRAIGEVIDNNIVLTLNAQS